MCSSVSRLHDVLFLEREKGADMDQRVLLTPCVLCMVSGFALPRAQCRRRGSFFVVVKFWFFAAIHAFGCGEQEHFSKEELGWNFGWISASQDNVEQEAPSWCAS